ncbi:hypothetical protein CI109_104874 [Kwoniella shandongensis]|uniref:Uncharacterized protein n=1 Tax=Kwoniella shandongensis TaxID=1734106 RepID=A0A5M6BSP9_9TREE|nr:uncharacterized protein CI109_006593 [Kwoniella shandongensis]KAA5525042.1 hypothetical protein CI109_006593 [Kwoniella shandongensis]
MQSPLKGSYTGWTGVVESSAAPSTVEKRRRKGRNVDVIGSSMPTPPQSHLPTPETVRRPAKQLKPSHLEPQASSSTSSHQPPTPQTQRRRCRNASASSSHADPPSPPSPSGHTTFFLSSSTASASRPDKIRRRPGLTFAQQMGLLSNPTSLRGVGVGIGGHKNMAHGKVDQIGGPITKTEENPFIVAPGLNIGQTLGAPVGLASPGAITVHQPRVVDSDDEEDGQPLRSPSRLRRSPRLASPSPSSNFTKVLLASTTSTGLLSPPPTFHAPRIGVITGGKTQGLTRARKEQRDRDRREAEDRRRMLDATENPFLVKAGEPSTRHPGPIVDEDQATVTYVFRGAKKVFANPLYPSRAPFPQAELDPEDDDFEPHPLPKPKLLWPSGPSTPSKRIRLEQHRTPSPDPDMSPPSSPVSTPTMMTMTTTRRRFARMDSTGTAGDIAGPKDVFTDEEVIIGHRHEDEDEDDDGEEALPSRRGLLFGGGGTGLKRGLDEEGERKSKKARGVLRL